MKRFILVLAVLSLLSMPLMTAASTSTGIGVNVTPTNSAPEIYMDGTSRTLYDVFGAVLTRANSYAFEGEQIGWQILVRDPNGKEDVASVDVSVGPNEGLGNPVEVSCVIASPQPAGGTDMSLFSPGLLFDTDLDRVYDCLLTVETAASMSGEYWSQALVTDDQGAQASVEEDSFFWFNPSIGLEIVNAPNGIIFGDLAPGVTGYSQTVLLRSNVATGSGVLLDVDIKGTDFYDPASSGAMCPTTNQLALTNFGYYATRGSYDTSQSATSDIEGYDSIGYVYGDMIASGDPHASYLPEGGEFAVTFKLNMPSPCAGTFTQGTIDFEGTVV